MKTPQPNSDQELSRAYVAVGKPLDHLPHTPDFARLCAEAGFSDHPDEAWRRLVDLRKRGELPKMFRQR